MNDKATLEYCTDFLSEKLPSKPKCDDCADTKALPHRQDKRLMKWPLSKIPAEVPMYVLMWLHSQKQVGNFVFSFLRIYLFYQILDTIVKPRKGPAKVETLLTCEAMVSLRTLYIAR